MEDLRSNLSVLFQTPVSYDASVRENIAVGDLNLSQDMDAIRTAARSAGVDEIARRLPRGYETLLGKSFADGTELSGGEWQRVAFIFEFSLHREVLKVAWREISFVWIIPATK